jgi:protoheme IX farnesyltransferase
MNLSRQINLYLELSKVRISFLVALSTASSFILQRANLPLDVLIPTVAVFILASGSSALNHIQEKKHDSLMERTRNRPVPSGSITQSNALMFSISMIIAGIFLLYKFSLTTPLVLGILNVFWYNVIYTPLKMKTPYAVLPGALIGAIPPAIGWTAAGGSLFDPFLLALATFFFIWQIPHFWLLLLSFGDQYSSAGYPTLTERFSDQKIARFAFSFMVLSGISCISIPYFYEESSIILYFSLILFSLWLLWSNRTLLWYEKKNRSLKSAFVKINLYVLFVMAVLTIDRLFNFHL